MAGLRLDLATDCTEQYIIEPAEVEDQLPHINLHKSAGPDGLPNWLLKHFAPNLKTETF